MAVASPRRPAPGGTGRSAPAYSAGSRVPRQRRVRRAVRHVEVMSVVKVSLVLYLSVLVVVLVAGGIVWGVLSAVGEVHRIENFINGLFGFKSFSVAGLQLLLVSILLGLVMVVLGTLFNVVCAILYNLTCDVVGGIQLIEIEEAPPSPGGPPAQGRVPGLARGG